MFCLEKVGHSLLSLFQIMTLAVLSCINRGYTLDAYASYVRTRVQHLWSA